MPKSAKKRKAKAADFSKTKLKLGKGKQLASNAIDTSYKARSIALPSQSITKDKDWEAPTTKRRLTFEELIAHSKHYSAGTRKDAILGFQELFTAHPEIISSSLTTLFLSCNRLIGDEDASVRKVLLSFFSFLLPRISKDQLSPHAQSLLLFATSAQTHIFPEIRVDAVRFLDLLLEHVPDAVVAGWNESGNQTGKRVLEGYLGLLNAGTKYGEHDGPLKATSTASVVLTPASKLVVTRSLSTFIRTAISSTTVGDSPRWFFASSFASSEAFNNFDRLLLSSDTAPSRQWQETYDDETANEDFVMNSPPTDVSDNAAFLDKLLSTSHIGEDSSSPTGFLNHLAQVLHSTLVSTFLDCSATVFSPAGNPPDTELQLVLAVGEIARAIYGEILQDTVTSSTCLEELSALLGHMGPFFPFTPSGRRDIKIEQPLQELNIIYCELSSLLLSAEQSNERVPSRKAKITRIDAVRDFVLRSLGDKNSPSAPQAFTAATYTALLPTIWTLITASRSGQSNDVLNAVVSHAISLSAKSALKRPATDFVARLILLDTNTYYRGHVRLSKVASHPPLGAFVEELPKALWEVGSSNLELSEVILRFLLRFLQCTPRSTPESLLVSLRSRLVPYFAVVHPTRGTLPGPYAKIPSSSPPKRLALDVAATLGVAGDVVDQAIEASNDGAYWCAIKQLS
ncbi:hypothetical protein CYLTODRAFT_361490 [Cylindrobasidium torrendii FP15055 ss-10]|uniref:Pre-rRNA-processing protein n=1 Tax=Cylindrobasidium torrendii FP15055 ss-10 TaxID=1314674 RepID=A0A0D7AX51_9AGAR|nr:hypothetical protein CYLTODRAFT_361490 [Cylindrobasidium torrendii FP15055 ss-10]